MLNKEEGAETQAGAKTLPPDLVPAVMKIRSHWPVVRERLSAKKHVAVTTQNSHTGAKLNRWRVVVENIHGTEVNLGKPFETEVLF
jgi:hypothetical protein